MSGGAKPRGDTPRVAAPDKAPRGRPFKKGNSGGPGRPPGREDNARRDIKEFYREFFESEEYRENLKARIKKGKVVPLEVLGHYYAYGKPKIKVEVGLPPGQFSLADIGTMLTPAEARLLAAGLQRIRSARRASVVAGRTILAVAGAVVEKRPLPPASKE